jgi:hypothetical protein
MWNREPPAEGRALVFCAESFSNCNRVPVYTDHLRNCQSLKEMSVELGNCQRTCTSKAQTGTVQ